MHRHPTPACLSTPGSPPPLTAPPNPPSSAPGTGTFSLLPEHDGLVPLQNLHTCSVLILKHFSPWSFQLKRTSSETTPSPRHPLCFFSLHCFLSKHLAHRTVILFSLSLDRAARSQGCASQLCPKSQREQ